MTDELLTELIDLQREANRWLRVMALPAVSEALSGALTTPEARRVYQASDGRTSREVGADAGVSHPTVLRYWNRWARGALVEQVALGRYRRVVSLDEVGLTETSE